MRHLLMRAGTLGLCLALACPTAARAQSPVVAAAPQSLTAQQWREDLRFMADRMERRHKNLFHTVSRKAFAAAVAELHARIPAMQRHEIIVGFMRIAAMVGDGHTNVSPLKDKAFGFRSLPLKLYLFDDGVFVRAAMPGQSALLGAEVEAVGGVPIAEAIRRVTAISPADNEYTPKLYVPIFLAMPEVLHALKLSPSPRSATLTLRKDGRRWTVTVPAAGVDPVWPPDTDISLVTPQGWIDARRQAPPPLWLQAPLDYHRLIGLPERQAIYVQLNMVTDTDGQSLAAFGARILDRVKATNPRRVIVDVRLNRGGNQDLRHDFVASLIKAEDEDTRLFVLSRRGAFSATQPILDDLARFTDAVLIGEPASSKPSSYGYSYRDVLPNSGITVRTSIEWHQFGRDDQPWTPIDLATALTFGDYLAGHDPALAAALEHVPGPALDERALEAAKLNGTAGAMRVATDYLSDPASRYADRQRELGRAALHLYRGKLADPALAVARLATDRFPESPEPWVRLALIADGLGRADQAVQAGRRALALEPDNRTARSLVERLAPSPQQPEG